MTLVSDHIVLDKTTRQKSFYAAELPLFVTHPHTDGGETPAGPVHQVEEQEAGHRDEVVVCRWTEESSHEKKGRKQRNSTLWSRMCSTSSCCRSVTQPDPTFDNCSSFSSRFTNPCRGLSGISSSTAVNPLVFLFGKHLNCVSEVKQLGGGSTKSLQPSVQRAFRQLSHLPLEARETWKQIFQKAHFVQF